MKREAEPPTSAPETPHQARAQGQGHGWWHRPRPMNRLSCYIRARLHRRIFIWFGTAILLAGLCAWAMMALSGGNEWKKDVDAGRAFAVHRFAETWDDEGARRTFAEHLHRDFRFDIVTRRDNGEVLDVVGGSCAGRLSYTLEIERDGAKVGDVEICSARFLKRNIIGIASIVAACFCLWLVSAVIARRITATLNELERAAIKIGLGDYEPEIRMGHHAPGEFQLLAHALRDMGAKIKGQMAEQRELLASVSHEIRSPLARIRLLLELSRPSVPPEGSVEPEERKAERENQEKAIADMEREIEEIDELVGGLLANSRVDFSALTRRPIDIEEATRRALDRAGVKAKLVLVGEKRIAEVDATLFARALANLLENAQAHGQGVDRVDVRFAEATFKVEVLDRGPGLLAGEEEKIFQSFYRRPSKSHESLGLGLALVRKIAEAHGGSVSARNRGGGGAAIGFEIPLPARED
ncbi:MAG: HAMP domain-containing sensor histidine kinase [Polyangiaceae bacterium]